MKHTQTRAQRTRQVQSLAILAMFTAIIFLLTFTPLGLIDLPVIKATVLHVPVIIGSILLGPKKGAFLGGMFGLASLLKNTLVHALFRRLPGRRGAGVQAGTMALAGVVGAFTNTALVMGSICVLFTEAYAAAQGIPAEAVTGFAMGIVAANGIPEAAVAAVVTPAVCVPLVKALKLERRVLPAAGQPV